MKPTIGRIVHYKLAAHDVSAIMARRSLPYTSPNDPACNEPSVGDVYPAMIVKTWGDTPESACNLQVHIDGNFIHWATSATCGDGPAQFQWPQRA